MAPHTPNIFSGGYDPDKAEQLKNTPLPDKIKCKVCKKIRSSALYSNIQQNVARTDVYRGHSPLSSSSTARCMTCTGGPTVEITCAACAITKGLDQFSKSQRRQGANARCLYCVQDQHDAEPVVEGLKEVVDDDKDDTTYASGLGSIPGSSVIGSFHNTGTRTPAAPLSVAESEDPDGDPDSGFGVWITKDGPSRGPRRTQGTPFTAFDPQGLGHQRFSTPSEAGTEADSQVGSQGGSQIGSQAGSQTAKGTPRDRSASRSRQGFAKIKAVHKPTRMAEFKLEPGSTLDHEAEEPEGDLASWI